MAKITMTEQPEFLVLPANSILLVKVDETEVREIQGSKGSWEKLEVKFKILDVQTTGDGSPTGNWDSLIGAPIWGSVPFRLTDSPENRLRQWIEALFDMSIDLGFELDTDLLIGRQARAVTSTYERKKFIDPKTGKPSLQHQIEALLPARQSGAPTPATPAGDPWATAPAGVATTSSPGWDETPPF